MKTSNTTVCTPGGQVPAWVGWYRPQRGQPWRRLAHATDYGTCWDLLLARSRALPGGDLLVSSRDPNRERQPP